MNVPEDDPMARVITVIDLSGERALLYSEIESRVCFLGRE